MAFDDDRKRGWPSLRDAVIAFIRSDKSAFEADEITMLERLYLDQRLS